MDFSIFGADFKCDQYYKEKYGSIENLISEARNGSADAQADLGYAYSEGVPDFVDKDTEKAIGWLNAAVEKGCHFPGVLGKLGELLDLFGTPEHQRKAYELYHRAAELGNPQSQLNLAEMYRCGVDGVINEDIKEAFKWYKRVADEDTFDPKSALGGVHYYIAGTVKKLANAVTGTKQKALKLLYKYYLEGECPERRPQPTKAVYYLNRAAEIGDTEAQRQLGQIYFSGSCEQAKDFAKARRWLGKASASGDVIARQHLRQLSKQGEDTQHNAAEVTKETLVQSIEIMEDKLRQAANVHPFVISQPVAFTEEMLGQFNWSPTARIYLQAYRLVKKGLEILHNSEFTDGRGISFIAHGFLTENSILQAFPQIKGLLLPKIFQLCEENLKKDPCFFEGLVLSFALRILRRTRSIESANAEARQQMCLKNLIQFIQNAEPNSLPSTNPFQFDKSYSSWLHVLYYHLGSIYTINDATAEAAEAFENSLKYCPGYFESKRGLGFSYKNLYISKKQCSERKHPNQDVPSEVLRNEPKAHDRKTSKYASWTSEKLRISSVRVLKEFLEEAPPCDKNYPNVYYYLAFIASCEGNLNELKQYYELGQDAEEKRLPFFDPVNLPLKDILSPAYQLLGHLRIPVGCGNRACKKKVSEKDLKSCPCGKQKYCGKDCQKADWKNHKSSCTSSKGGKAKGGT